MGTTYHTAIPFGSQITSAAINGPDGQLDDAIAAEAAARAAADATVAGAALGHVKAGGANISIDGAGVISATQPTVPVAYTSIPQPDASPGVVGNSPAWSPGNHTHPPGQPGAHKNFHVHGGVDAFAPTDVLDAVANVQVNHNSTLVGTEPKINLADGQDINLTVLDNPGGGRVDITIATVRTAWVAADTALQAQIGTLASLATTTHTDLVSAVNEVDSEVRAAREGQGSVGARIDQIQAEFDSLNLQVTRAIPPFPDLKTRLDSFVAAGSGYATTTSGAAGHGAPTLAVVDGSHFLASSRIEYPLNAPAPGLTEYNVIVSIAQPGGVWTLTLSQPVGYSAVGSWGVSSGVIVAPLSQSVYDEGAAPLQWANRPLTSGGAMRAVANGTAWLAGFGADMTGNTDNTPLIVEAVRQLLLQGGGQVVYPPGISAQNYAHTSGNNIWFVGQGGSVQAGVSRCVPWDQTLPVFRFGMDVAGTYFRDVGMDQVTCGPRGGLGPIGIYVGGGADNCTFRRVVAANFTQYDLLVQSGTSAGVGAQINNLGFYDCEWLGGVSQTAVIAMLNSVVGGLQQLGAIWFSGGYASVNATGNVLLLDGAQLNVQGTWFQCGTLSGNRNGVKALHSNAAFSNPCLIGMANIDSNNSGDILLQTPDTLGIVANYLRGQIHVDGIMEQSDASTIDLKAGTNGGYPWHHLLQPTAYAPYVQKALYLGTGAEQSATNGLVPDASNNLAVNVGGDVTFNVGGGGSSGKKFGFLSTKGLQLPRYTGATLAAGDGPLIYFNNNDGHVYCWTGTASVRLDN